MSEQIITSINKNCGSIPKSMNSKNTPFVSMDLDGQATRQYCREIAGLSFPNARNSPSVIFMVANQMSLIHSKYHFDMEGKYNYLGHLRKIAILQASMEVMISKGKYDGFGVYSHWKNGTQIKMHYTSHETHISLHTDPLINPFKLSAPLWWAIMMTMLGLFNEQLSYYESALKGLSIDLTETALLNWFHNQYGKFVEGELVFLEVNPEKNSFITCEPFEKDEEVYQLEDHGNCTTKCWMSSSEMDLFFTSFTRCPICRMSITRQQFILVNRIEYVTQLDDAYRRAKPLTVNSQCPSMIEDISLKRSETNFTPAINSRSNILRGKRFRQIVIDIFGTVGCGKSKSVQILEEELKKLGFLVLIVSADKWSKKGLHVQSNIKRELFEFQNIRSPLKAVIIDICHENGTSNFQFGYEFRPQFWENFEFYPNLDKTQSYDYDCWSLKNVLERPLHTESSDFWLNMHSAGLKTVISVHNKKSEGLHKLLQIPELFQKFDETASLEKITSVIAPGAFRYATYLATRSLENDISDFIKSFC